MSNAVHLKNMVCPRCISVVSNIFEQFEIPYISIKLGEVKLVSSLNVQTKNGFSKRFKIQYLV